MRTILLIACILISGCNTYLGTTGYHGSHIIDENGDPLPPIDWETENE